MSKFLVDGSARHKQTLAQMYQAGDGPRRDVSTNVSSPAARHINPNRDWKNAWIARLGDLNFTSFLAFSGIVAGFLVFLDRSLVR